MSRETQRERLRQGLPRERAGAAGHASAASAPGPGGIIVFDSVCVLCGGWVRFLLRHDKAGRYRFAAMQGRAGADLLTAQGLDPKDPVSFLLVEDAQADQPGRAWTDSDAVLRVLTGLGGLWRLLAPLRLLPRALRDPAYPCIARHRYRLFGRRDRCPLPDPAQAHRFLP